jgi:hypothetical protein
VSEAGAAVFVVTLEAVEAAGEPRLTVLAFVAAETEDAATAEAVAELERLRWSEIAALRAGEIVEPDAVPEDMRQALENARRYGCALIIYDEP